MPFVTVKPEMLAMAADGLLGIGSQMSAGNAAAAGPPTGVVSAAADEVSVLMAAQFGADAAMYPAVQATTAVFDALGASGVSEDLSLDLALAQRPHPRVTQPAGVQGAGYP
jgi:hypothetical protein